MGRRRRRLRGGASRKDRSDAPPGAGEPASVEESAAAHRAPGPALPKWVAFPGVPWMALVLGFYGLLQYRFVLGMPFVADDYAILDKVGHASFASLWTAEHPLYGWYRPWSRELHFWTLSRLFGANELPFHIASLLLWVAVLAAYFSLVRRMMGTAGAAVATAGAATVAAWGSTLSWAAGVQELWMLLFALLFLHATARRRPAAASLALAGALLSKETAAVLPAIALLYALAVDRDRPLAALRRVAPAFALVAVWAALHPFLRARVAGHFTQRAGESVALSPLTIATRTGLSVVNLDHWPAPEIGWLGALIPSLAGIVVLAAGAAWALRRAPAADARAGVRAEPDPSAGGAAVFGSGWAALGALPLFMPSVGWLPYYALLCALGAWVVLAAGLVRRPWIALTLLTMLAVLQPVHAATPALEWASDYYQRRAAYFVGGLKRYLLERHPALPPHTRLYFLGVPNGTGIGQPWFNPAFRVWYRDSTLRGDFFRNYAARGAGEPPDRDYFFRFDPGALTWSEVVKGAEDVDRERGANRLWASDHRDLALMLGDAGDWRGAAAEVEKLVSAFPDNPEFRLNLALCLGNLGDTLGAKRTMRSADSLRAAHRVQKKP